MLIDGWVVQKVTQKTGTKIKRKFSRNMIKTLLSERHKSIVKKTNRNRHDSKFHEYGAKSNFDTCFKNVLSMTIIN